MSNFRYKITSFNSETKLLDVDFFEDGVARIQLVEPLPSTPEELEDTLRQYVHSVEVVSARSSPVDVGFIADLIGEVRETSREKLIERVTVSIAPDVVSSELRYIHAQIEVVLRKHKLI